MALQSKLFRGDPNLEAAAMSDPAHITLGARGDHVAKIQQALIALDGAKLSIDRIYGPLTAAAVKAYKRARDIVDRRRQTQADDIVGIMTMAVLDKEMLAKEKVPTGPVRIDPVLPEARPSPPSRGRLLLAFSIDVNFPVFPNGAPQTVRLESRTTGSFEIINGSNGTVRCTNVVAGGFADALKTALMFDPAEPSFIPQSRLNPVRRGPNANRPFESGGTFRVTSDRFTVQVDALMPGTAFIDASTATSANRVTLEVRAPKIVGLPVFSPPTKTRAGSRFISSADSEPNLSGRNEGRPVGPKGTGRKINIFGSGETPGFEDYTSDLGFSVFTIAKDGRPEDGTNSNMAIRPWTEDSDPNIGIKNGEASDICIRDSRVLPVTTKVLQRIAGPGCRITFSGTDRSTEAIANLKAAFPNVTPSEETANSIVIELP